MKLSYIAPSLGACALLTLASCSSTDGDGYTESALPMSEVADGEIPPWLLEDDGTNGAHVSAGARTPSLADARNNYTIPEPTESTAKAGSSRQNQPTVDAGQDGTFVETHPMDAGDPLAGTGTSVAVNTPAVPKPPVKTTPRPPKSSNTGRKPSQPTMVVYKVRPGDNLSEIAKRSNTTVSQIMKDSKLTSTVIHPGQTIKVRYTPKGYKAGSGKGANGSGTKGGKKHTVTSGQTLSGIAKRYGVTTSQLMKANGLTEADARKIRPGQQLTIPAKKKK